MPPLKRTIESIDDLPEEVKSLYKKGADGKYHLEVEDDGEAKAKLDEFRLNNIKLKKEKEELEKKLAGLDPDEYEAMKKKLQSLDEKKLIDAGKLDEVVNQRTERMRADFQARTEALEKTVKELTADRETLTSKLAKVLIEGEVMKAVNQYAVPKKDAIDDIMGRAKATWIMENGEPVPKMGDKLLYGKDGKSLLTFPEYAENLVKTAPHLFEETKGTGTKGADGKGPRGGKIDPEQWKNLSPTEKLKQAREQASR
ncbi:MAG TPA: hypothetical protein PLR20_14760 [Syntrophales bacterium]|jgi:hypothetical protein|nr:hypothetical protein [Syntrophales bacterium]